MPRPGALVVRSDVERKHLSGVAETEHLSPEGYRPEANARVYNALIEKAARMIAAGHSVIVDAVFAKSDERAAIAAVSASANRAFHGAFLVADLQTRLNRVGRRSLDASDADTAVALQQETLTLGQVDWTEIDAAGPLDSTLARGSCRDWMKSRINLVAANIFVFQMRSRHPLLIWVKGN